MPVRAVETITASRAMLFSLAIDQGKPDGGKRGALLTLDLYGDCVTQQPLPGRFLLDRVKREASADALARADRREEAHAVEPVIDGHPEPFGHQHRFFAHARQ